MKKIVLITTIFVFVSCFTKPELNISPEQTVIWPSKIDTLPRGILVTHSPKEIFATPNTKDPEKHGKYQLKHSTTIETIKEDLEIIEFGGYFLINGEWVFKTIYDRPLNNEEFSKWYDCTNGVLRKGEKYTDKNNWMAKSNHLNQVSYRGLWYYIGKNKGGKLFTGASEITGHLKMK